MKVLLKPGLIKETPDCFYLQLREEILVSNLRKSIIIYNIFYLDLFCFIKITSGESELLPKNEKFASWIVEVILGINLLSL